MIILCCICYAIIFGVDIFCCKQRLSAGIDPSTAFILSSEAAIAGAESTKHMQAQVSLLLISLNMFILTLMRVVN